MGHPIIDELFKIGCVEDVVKIIKIRNTDIRIITNIMLSINSRDVMEKFLNLLGLSPTNLIIRYITKCDGHRILTHLLKYTDVNLIEVIGEIHRQLPLYVPTNSYFSEEYEFLRKVEKCIEEIIKNDV